MDQKSPQITIKSDYITSMAQIIVSKYGICPKTLGDIIYKL